MMSAVPHDPELCGLEIGGRPLCTACRVSQRAELEAHATAAAERRRRRRAAIRRALPSVVRAWLRALIRREVRRGLEDAT